MLRVPNFSQGPTHSEWVPVQLVRTNDSVVLSVIMGLLTSAHIPYTTADRNVSTLAGGADAFPVRIIVGDCCGADARQLLAQAGYGRELSP